MWRSMSCLLSLLAGGSLPRDGLRQQGNPLFSAEWGFHAPGAEAAPNEDPRWREYERDLFEPTPEGEWVGRVVGLPEGFALFRWTGWEDRRVERL